MRFSGVSFWSSIETEARLLQFLNISKQKQPAFEKATLATKIGEMSPVIESDSGVHIIFRYA